MGRRGKFSIAKEKLGALSFPERLLLALSKHPDDVDRTSSYEKPTAQWTLETALSQLTDAFPDFVSDIKGKRVLDYGCGDGFQSVAMARAGAGEVLGVEIEGNRRAHAMSLAGRERAANVSFADTVSGEFDIVVSLNAMEHFTAPEENLREMKNALAPGGRIYLSFGPLWFAPYGAHMYFFSPVPWINLLFPEETVFRIRSLYRDDGETTYEPNLNRMTVAGFERLVAGEGLRASHCVYRAVLGLPLISRVPGLRELCVNQVDAVLEPADVQFLHFSR